MSRNSKEYRLWRARVIRRDVKCVICDSLQNRQAHHINSFSYFEELQYKEDNGVCLCRDCHIQFHTNFKNSFREKCTIKDWLNFIKLTEYLKDKYGAV